MREQPKLPSGTSVVPLWHPRWHAVAPQHSTTLQNRIIMYLNVKRGGEGRTEREWIYCLAKNGRFEEESKSKASERPIRGRKYPMHEVDTIRPVDEDGNDAG